MAGSQASLQYSEAQNLSTKVERSVGCVNVCGENCWQQNYCIPIPAHRSHLMASPERSRSLSLRVSLPCRDTDTWLLLLPAPWAQHSPWRGFKIIDRGKRMFLYWEQKQTWIVSRSERKTGFSQAWIWLSCKIFSRCLAWGPAPPPCPRPHGVMGTGFASPSCPRSPTGKATKPRLRLRLREDGIPLCPMLAVLPQQI